MDNKYKDMSLRDLTNRIVVGVIRRSLDERVSGKLMEPELHKLISFVVTDKLRILQETFRIEEYKMPEVWQDEQDPTIFVVRFKYVPTRNFDWNKPIEWITLEFRVSPLGVSERIESATS